MTKFNEAARLSDYRAKKLEDNSSVGTHKVRVLVVDDDVMYLRSIERILKAKGFWVTIATSGSDAIRVVAEHPVDVMLLDMVMPEMSGLDVLRNPEIQSSSVQVVIMTAFGDVDAAVVAVKSGAHDFLTKPFQSPEALALCVNKAAEHAQLLNHTKKLEKELEIHEKYGDIVGSSAPMREVYRMVDSVAHSTSTVLLQGESGTGKELVARAIHGQGPRADKPFVAINCSAIPDTMIEVELFGHVQGAFTGAMDSRQGLFEAANGGTIMLDEIGDLPAQAQVKLLRVLQDGEFKRVGSAESTYVDCRVVAASNVDLYVAMQEKRFREDLYYRLSVITIPLPALRDRPDDVTLLAHHFLKKYAARSGREITRMSQEAIRALRLHSWPGNVRELENAIERAVVLARKDVILPGDLPPAVIDTVSPTSPANVLLDLSFAEAKKQAIDQFEANYALAMLKRAGGNVSEAARQAGMDRSNFRRVLRKFKNKV